jgi:hypothetical protein
MECARMIQVECGHAMQHSPEFVDEDVGSVGFTISPDQPGSDYGLAASKLRCAIVPTSSRSIGTPQCAMDPCRHHSFWFLDAISVFLAPKHRRNCPDAIPWPRRE